MTPITRLFERNIRFVINIKFIPNQFRKFSSELDEKLDSDEEFRVLNLRQSQQQYNQRRPRPKRDPPMPPRTHKMPVDQNWGSVWPGPRTFHPASVPLPLRQGFTEKGAAPPSKFGNAELMKIQNFLHLTPPVIRRQCEAIKKFCTPWPEKLDNEEIWQEHFPIEYISTDYIHALPTIRNPLARVIAIKIKLGKLKFDQHAKDKFLRLVGDRYNPENDILTIVTDRCPMKKQNFDYAMYLLTACYHESFITEPWESTKSEADMECYDFNKNKSKISAEAILNWGKNITDDGDTIQVSEEFSKSVETLINDGENEYNLQKYKEEAKKLLGIQYIEVRN